MKIMVCITALACMCGCENFGTFTVQSPINRACQSRDIKGCSDLTDGVVDYIHGDKLLGISKLDNAVKENDAKPLAGFADALDILANEYDVPSLHNIVNAIRVQLAGKVSNQTLNNITPKIIPKKEEACLSLTDQQLKALRAPLKPISASLQEIFVCKDDKCEHYESARRAILCIDSLCNQWEEVPMAGHESDSRK
jgi:hypothetical protein